MDADISWMPIFHGRRYFMGANISWARIFPGRENFMGANISFPPPPQWQLLVQSPRVFRETGGFSNLPADCDSKSAGWSFVDGPTDFPKSDNSLITLKLMIFKKLFYLNRCLNFISWWLCCRSWFLSYTAESSCHLMAAIIPKEALCQEKNITSKT